MSGSDKVIVEYSASSNISFRGKRELPVTVDEWNEMSGREQDELINDELNDLVQIWPTNVE